MPRKNWFSRATCSIRDRRTARVQHRLELAQQNHRRARRVVQHGRIVDPVSGESDRAREQQRPTAVDRGALQEQTRLSGAHHECRAKTGSVGLLARSEIAVPLASNTGWNLRNKTIGAPDELYSMVGSWIPFPVNQTERENNKDPRLSIEERYKNKRDYLERITNAAQKLVQSGYLLDQDVPKVRDRAAKEWDYVLRSN